MPILLALALIGDAIGEAFYDYYQLHQQTAFPSWADVFYLSAYAFQLLGILLLSARPLSGTTRLRVLLDGLMIMVAVVTVSWYFILGPTLLQGDGTALAKIVGTAYPFLDLVTVFCILILSYRSRDPALMLSVRLLSLALMIITLTDSIYDFQSLQNAYVSGGLLDVGWPLGYTLIGIAVQAMRLNRNRPRAAIPVASGELAYDPPSALPSLLPYLLASAVILFAFYGWHLGLGGPLAAGVYIGSAVLVGLVMLRQVLATRETISHNGQLRSMQQELRVKNQALYEAIGRLETLATTDVLTNLPNHRAILEQLDKEFERACRFGRPLSIAFFDGDHFKQVNDTYGHAVGDVVLCELGERVRGTLRAGDTLGRYGGEEFLVLLPETDTGEACIVAERMRSAVAALPLAMAQVQGGVSTTISIGVATYPTDGNSGSEILEKADHSMYWAKRLGRNQVRTVSEAQRASRDSSLAGTIHSLERRDEVARDGMGPERMLHADLLGVVYSLMWLIELRDHGISAHSNAVSDFASAIAQKMGLDRQVIFTITTAGLLHDIGKIAIPDALLQKTGHLQSSEWDLIKQHPALGAQILEISPSLRDLVPAIRYHHERWDGAGYPDRLVGEAIPLEARIIAVAEAYQAMVADRAYQAGRSSQAAIAELQRCAGTQFDPRVVQAAVAVLSDRQEDEVRTPEIAGTL